MGKFVETIGSNVKERYRTQTFEYTVMIHSKEASNRVKETGISTHSKHRFSHIPSEGENEARCSH